MKFDWKISIGIIFTAIIIGGIYFSRYSRNFEKVAFEEVSIDDYCFPFKFYVGVPEYERKAGKQYIDEELVIQNDAEYNKLLEFRRRTNENCENIQSETYKNQCYFDKSCEQKPLPAVDFSSKTLLGKYTHGSCAATEFEKSLSQDTESKTYLYSIKTKERFLAHCSGSGLQSMNFITVPKISADYIIKFEPLVGQRKYYVSDGKGGWIEKDTQGNVVPSSQ